jgi:hypothetical protein
MIVISRIEIVIGCLIIVIINDVHKIKIFIIK